MITAAALCPSPPLLARELTGQTLVLPELRDACAMAVRQMLAAAPGVVVVVGPAEMTAAWRPDGQFDMTVYAPALAGARSGESLPLSLGIGALLLDDAGYRGERLIQGIAAAAPPQECRRLGRELAQVAPRVALLVMGDGTARRSVTAPGYLDERAAPFDAGVERAVRDGDMAALASLDPVLAADLMATGRPAWQVLAGALAAPPAGRGDAPAGRGDAPDGRGDAPDGDGNAPDGDGDGAGRPRAEILYCDAPLGVSYLAAVLSPASTRRPGPGA